MMISRLTHGKGDDWERKSELAVLIMVESQVNGLSIKAASACSPPAEAVLFVCTREEHESTCGAVQSRNHHAPLPH
jgi:hypothetical protein